MTQGYTLTMISYIIVILPLIREFRAAHPHVMQLWYADDAGTGGTFADLQAHTRDLMVRGPPWGYFPEPTKSMLFVSPRNVPRTEAYFWDMEVRVVTRSRYLGGFIGELAMEKAWIAEKLKGWTESVEMVEGVLR